MDATRYEESRLLTWPVSVHIVHIGQAVVFRFPYMKWYTISGRPGPLNNSLSRAEPT